VKRLLSLKHPVPGHYLLFLFLYFAVASCSSVRHTQTPGVEQPEETHVHHESEETDYSDLEALYWSRLEASRSSYTRADVDFMTDMITHHAQALIMSRLAPENGASRSVQALAARIHNAQGDEIATMQKWLRDRNQPVPEVHIDGLKLMVELKEPDMENALDEHESHEVAEGSHGEHHQGHDETDDTHQMMMTQHQHHDMPGMLTQDQLEELADARELEFDRKFLTFMIEHHLGAVYMVDQLFDSDGAANDHEIYDLASDIHTEQVTEINRMRLMLEEIASAEN
jgi:uncharacterized protein (DUF305 family)